jgi:hypothetical protein
MDKIISHFKIGSRSKIFKKKDILSFIKPRQHWMIVLSFGALIALSGLGYGIYLFWATENDTAPADTSPTASAELLNSKKLESVLKIFEEKKSVEENLRAGKLDVHDPSL